MGTREFARQMKSEIQKLKEQGVAAVYVDNLISYLNSVETSPDPNPSPADLEHYRAQLQQHIESMKHAHESGLEMFRSVITAGQNSIRSIIAINGGASVALLAFVGHLARIGSTSIPAYADCMILFVVGTLLGGVTSGATYLGQWFYGSSTPRMKKIGFGLNIFTILLGASAYVAFGWGAYATYDAFISNPPIGNPEFVSNS